MSGRTAEARYAALAASLQKLPGVTRAERGFGSGQLATGGRLFALLDSPGRFVVKLPRARVDALVAAGEGQRFDPRRDGRVMKEWLAVDPRAKTSWPALAREALRHARAG